MNETMPRFSFPTNHVVVIDVDSEDFENVIVVDVPQPKGRQCTENLRGSNQTYVNVIHIDDDEDKDDSHSVGVENVCSSTGGTTHRKESSPSGKNPAHAAVDESQFINDNVTPVRLYKCKRTYSGNANLYGSDTTPESNPSDYDYCELVEDSSGKVQELWRKRFSKKATLDKSFLDHGTSHADFAYGNGVQVNPRSCFMSSGKHPISSNTSVNSEKNPNAEPCQSNMDFSFRVVEDETVGVASSLGTDDKNVHEMHCGIGSEPEYSESIQRESIGKAHETQPPEDEGVKPQNQTHDASTSEQGCLPVDREKFKETEAFRKGLEEEMASRQQALQAQAAEAKRLRAMVKRSKAESMRLLDMERRQKERVDDIRTAQKKEEEIFQEREKIRAEICKELNALQVKCKTMASLLNSLGITVAGWPHPSSTQVKASFKKALITFHPDRALRSNIQQQVYAEEKFKLIKSLEKKMS